MKLVILETLNISIRMLSGNTNPFKHILYMHVKLLVSGSHICKCVRDEIVMRKDP